MTNDNLAKYRDQFKSAIAYTKTVRRAEAILPRVAITVVAEGALVTASWLGVWHSLPPAARVLALLPLVAGVVPWVRNTRDLHVTDEDACRRMDFDAGESTLPAQTLLGGFHNDQYNFAEAGLLKRHAQLFEARKPSPIFSKRLAGASALLALSSVVTGVMAGQQRGELLMEAFNWGGTGAQVAQAAVAKTKLEAWVQPPKNFPGDRRKLTEQTVETSFSTHKNSTMTVLVLSDNASVSLNGAPLPGKLLGQEEKKSLQYEFALAEGANDIVIDKGPHDRLKWHVNVSPDDAPTVTLETVAADGKDQGLLVAAGRTRDDYPGTNVTMSMEPADASPYRTPVPGGLLPVNIAP